MIPVVEQPAISTAQIVREPGKTYRLNRDCTALTGVCDGAEAVGQAAMLRLSTQRNAYRIYSEDYGIPIGENLGALTDIAYARLIGAIERTLFEDDRIRQIRDVVFEEREDSLHISLRVGTIYGTTEAAVDV